MNEPIISPWIFYWISLADKIGVVAACMTGISLFCLALYAVFAIAGEFDNIEDDTKNRLTKVRKFLTYSFLTFSPITLFLPGQETMYKMLITSQVTPNNIEYLKNEVKATGQGLVDSITDASIKIIKAKESKQ